jgi:hypothetical protein
MIRDRALPYGVLALCILCSGVAQAADARAPATYARVKAYLDSVKAIDTHSHLRGPDYFAEAASKGRGFTLANLWTGSYLSWIAPVPGWQPGTPFETWWQRAQTVFDDVRATSSYRYMLPAFRDLYGVDFDTLTAQGAQQLNDRVVANNRNRQWVSEVVTRRANIERMLVDANWARLRWQCDYPFTAVVVNVNTLVRGTHPDQYRNSPQGGRWDSPYIFAQQRGIRVQTFDDYLKLVETILTTGKQKGGVCLKTTLAYQRTLQFDEVPRARAERAFGKPPEKLSPPEIKDFEDFIVWHLVRLSAKLDLPFQIHTGHARIQGSNPMLLADLIQANPKTKFVLLHGGYPWVGETCMIAMKYRNVWIDSVWLPTLNFTMARRAYQEWLDGFPSDRIMWGSDVQHAEGVYGATQFTRQCLAEALAEKIDRGELREDHALRIGRQILRENALRLFPSLAPAGLPDKPPASSGRGPG